MDNQDKLCSRCRIQNDDINIDIKPDKLHIYLRLYQRYHSQYDDIDINTPPGHLYLHI